MKVWDERVVVVGGLRGRGASQARRAPADLMGPMSRGAIASRRVTGVTRGSRGFVIAPPVVSFVVRAALAARRARWPAAQCAMTATAGSSTFWRAPWQTAVTRGSLALTDG